MKDSTVMLSNIRPKKPLMSPIVNHSYLKGFLSSAMFPPNLRDLADN